MKLFELASFTMFAIFATLIVGGGLYNENKEEVDAYVVEKKDAVVEYFSAE